MIQKCKVIGIQNVNYTSKRNRHSPQQVFLCTVLSRIRTLKGMLWISFISPTISTLTCVISCRAMTWRSCLITVAMSAMSACYRNGSTLLAYPRTNAQAPGMSAPNPQRLMAGYACRLVFLEPVPVRPSLTTHSARCLYFVIRQGRRKPYFVCVVIQETTVKRRFT